MSLFEKDRTYQKPIDGKVTYIKNRVVKSYEDIQARKKL